MEPIKKYTILYVDDEPINLELFEMTFRNTFDILLAESGDSALAILEENSAVQIVISDLKMPYMSGLEFIKKATLINNSTAYFLLSGYSITQEIAELIKSGLVKKYFLKPFDKLDIINSINKLMESKK